MGKDIGLKVATKIEALWMRVRDEAKQLIQQSEDNLVIQKAMLKIAEDKILLEQRK